MKKLPFRRKMNFALQLLQLLLHTNDLNGMLACSFLTVGHFIYMFFCNLAGQIVTDHNTDILNITYVINI